jgi:hypothetical protein
VAEVVSLGAYLVVDLAPLLEQFFLVPNRIACLRQGPLIENVLIPRIDDGIITFYGSVIRFEFSGDRFEIFLQLLLPIRFAFRQNLIPVRIRKPRFETNFRSSLPF